MTRSEIDRLVELVGGVVESPRHDARRLVGRHRGLSVEILDAAGTVHIVVDLIGIPDVDVEVARVASAVDSAATATGFEVATGDAAFDAVYRIDGLPRDSVLAILDAPVRGWLLDRRPARLEIARGRLRWTTAVRDDLVTDVAAIVAYAASISKRVEAVVLARRR